MGAAGRSTHDYTHRLLTPIACSRPSTEEEERLARGERYVVVASQSFWRAGRFGEPVLWETGRSGEPVVSRTGRSGLPVVWQILSFCRTGRGADRFSGEAVAWQTYAWQASSCEQVAWREFVWRAGRGVIKNGFFTITLSPHLPCSMTFSTFMHVQMIPQEEL